MNNQPTERRTIKLVPFKEPEAVPIEIIVRIETRDDWFGVSVHTPKGRTDRFSKKDWQEAV